MIENAAISPFADERRNKARADIFLPDGTLLRSFGEEKVLEVSLIQEFPMKQPNSPRSETTVVFDNQDNYFDVANPESALYSITNKSFCDIYLSSTEHFAADSFVKKSRCFFDGVSDGGLSFSLRFIDVLSCRGFENRSMVGTFDSSSNYKTVGEIVAKMVRMTGCMFEADIPEDISETRLEKSSFLTYDSSGTANGYETLGEGLFSIARRFSEDESQVYLMPDRDGKLSYIRQQTEKSQTITKKHFYNYEILQEEDYLISRVSDRGNLLLQLGDVVEVADGNKIFKTEIYKIHYRFARGILSSEWEGVIVQ